MRHNLTLLYNFFFGNFDSEFQNHASLYQEWLVPHSLQLTAKLSELYQYRGLLGLAVLSSGFIYEAANYLPWVYDYLCSSFLKYNMSGFEEQLGYLAEKIADVTNQIGKLTNLQCPRLTEQGYGSIQHLNGEIERLENLTDKLFEEIDQAKNIADGLKVKYPNAPYLLDTELINSTALNRPASINRLMAAFNQYCDAMGNLQILRDQSLADCGFQSNGEFVNRITELETLKENYTNQCTAINEMKQPIQGRYDAAIQRAQQHGHGIFQSKLAKIIGFSLILGVTLLCGVYIAPISTETAAVAVQSI